MRRIKVNNSIIGENAPLYFIADIGANHDGDIQRAFELIDLAAEAGASAAKFQNFQADKIVSKEGFENLGDKISHQSSWKKSVYEVYKDASISFEWTSRLKEKCDNVGIEYFTSPYDFESVDKVDSFVNVYKIGSGDITWLEIIEHIAKKNKPVMLATGASDLNDVERAMGVLLKHTEDIVLMQCNTNYTGSSENFRYINLNVLKTYKALYPDVVLGLSDHTQGHSTVLGAIALGARVFEKHFTDDNDREGPDHKFAMNPKTWKEMLERSNELYLALGDGKKVIEPNEMQAAIVQRRALYAAADITENAVLTKDLVEVLRPISESGVPPYKLQDLLGKRVIKSIKKGELISINSISYD